MRERSAAAVVVGGAAGAVVAGTADMDGEGEAVAEQ